jgi:Tol biopolymer transport system component
MRRPITRLLAAALLLVGASTFSGITTRAQDARKAVLWSGNNVGDVQSISPDGKLLAYVDRSQQFSVAIRDLGSGTNRIIARGLTAEVTITTGLRPSLSEAAGEVVFSSDGSQVAYSWAKYREDVYELRIADVRDGGNVRVVATMAAGSFIKLHDWSKDGKWFVVERMGSSDAQTADYLLISVADGTSRVAKTVDGQSRTSRIAFSPDGRYVAYDRPPVRNAAQHDVFVLAVENSVESTAAASPADDFVVGWSPDGRYLLFTNQEGGTVNLRGQPIANGLVEGVARTLRADVGGRAVGINGSGQVLISVITDPMTVYGAEVNRESGALRTPPERLSPERWAVSWAPTFTSDGRRLAFLSRSAGGGGIGAGPGVSLSVKSVDTGQITTLPLKLLQISSLDWSPDGRTLIAGASDYQGRFGVHLIDAASGIPTPVAIYKDGLRFTGSQWAASGRRVYYNKTPQGVLTAATHTIRELNVATSEERLFLDWAAVRTTDGAPFETIRNVQVSPDDQLVVAVGTVTGSAGALWLVSVKDKSARLLPLELEAGPFPISNDFTWTPDGRAVLVNRRDGTARERSLWFVPVDGSKAVRLAIDLPIQDGASDVHPDGRRIAFVSGSSGTRAIHLLDGFLPPSGR